MNYDFFTFDESNLVNFGPLTRVLDKPKQPGVYVRPGKKFSAYTAHLFWTYALLFL